jgi:beta-N-acetylhexosaminidase
MRYTRPEITLIALLSLALATSAGWAPSPLGAPAPALAQVDPVAERMAQMTTEEKVGQLFVVGFWGRNPSPPSRAGRLIQEFKIGGVVLLAGNNNVVNGAENTPEQVATLCANLQGMALDEDAGPGIPLFIAVDHEGDAYPYTQITGGLTPLPSPMAIGATWNARYVEQVGEIAGHELSAMGINVVLGPVVDVLADPRPGGQGDIGTRVFGGDPYWVSEMGRAYIRGVHVGSQGRVLTVAKHFPGHGGTDRLPGDEVATVDKSLQELRRVELTPFFAVTNPVDVDGLDRTDAMMSSHIRYRGLFGDIRQFTRPIPFDAESMQALLDLPEFREWRETGLMVSDSLGVPAVRKYFDPQLRTFPHRQIAREAFLAGNDLLLLTHFALVDDWAQQFDNIVETVRYFRESYERDPSFAARVDEAVARILRAKLALYPELSPSVVLDPLADFQSVGQGSAVVDTIARRAVTILQPTVDSMPPAPRRDQDILIFAEERMVRECSDPQPECDPRPLVAPSAVQETLLRLYGPQGTGQVDPERVHTRTYAQLKSYLTRTSDENDVGSLLQGAEWIVFPMLDPDPRYPDSDVLQLFLAQNAHQIYNANVVVLAHTAPYYLDTTEISKLTAYYVFYGKTSPAIEASVRTLFGEVRPRGRSPVSIEGTSYDLSTQLAPDPSQQIALELIQPETPAADVPVSVQVRTRSIHDRNGNPVPDGTQVRFVAREDPSGQIIDTAITPTEGGVAGAELSIDRPGRILLVASSGDAGDGRPLVFAATRPPTPTPLPSTPTRTPTTTVPPTAVPTSEPTAIPTPSPTATIVPSPQPTRTPLPPLTATLDTWSGRPPDLVGVLTGILLAVGIGYMWWGRRTGTPRRARLVLVAWIGGLAAYLTYGWGWVPIGQWIPWPTWIVAALLAFLGASLLAIVLRISSGQDQNT